MRSVLIAGLSAILATTQIAEAYDPAILGGIQSTYSIDDNELTDGIEVKMDLTWINGSDNAPANNQIEANGTFGYEDSGLSLISTTDNTHSGRGDTPTYNINPTSFIIDYASGIVNAPGNQDIFTFKFNLGTEDQTKANAVVDELNALINGTMNIGEAQYSNWKNINGKVSGFETSLDFENSPGVYTPNIAAIPEPATNNVSVTLNLSSSTLSFPTQSNEAYFVMSSTNLLDGFTTVTNVLGNGSTNTISADTSSLQKYWQVKGE